MEAQTCPLQPLLCGTCWGRHRQGTEKPQVPRTEGTPMCCHDLSQGWETCLFLHRKAWEKWLRTGPWRFKSRNQPQRRNLTQKINSQNIVYIKGLLWAFKQEPVHRTPWKTWKDSTGSCLLCCWCPPSSAMGWIVRLCPCECGQWLRRWRWLVGTSVLYSAQDVSQSV